MAIGFGISRNWAVIVCLETFPTLSPLQFAQLIGEPEKGYAKQKGTFPLNEIAWKLECNAKGIEILKSLNITTIVLEPTGYWYAAFWVNAAGRLGIEIKWIGHQQVKVNRQHYWKTQNKDDYLDAFTMALTYFDPTCRDALGNPPLLQHYNHDSIELLRRTFHEREQLDKTKNGLTNQLRQRLSLEHPEISQRDFEYIGVNGVNPTLGHIARLRKNNRIKKTAGTGFSFYSQRLAGDIIDYQQRLVESEGQLSEILALDEFYPYTRIFKLFGWGVVTASLLLLHTYPIDRFFVDGKPYGQGNHDMSPQKFQAYLGLSYSYEKSGDTSAKQDRIKKKWKGSDLVRCHLYAHALVTICPDKPESSEIIGKLKNAWFNRRTHNYHDIDPKTGAKVPKSKDLPSFKELGKDGLCRLLFYETRLLYQELIKLK